MTERRQATTIDSMTNPTEPAASLDDLRAQRDALSAVIASAEADEAPEVNADDVALVALDGMIDALRDATQAALAQVAAKREDERLAAVRAMLVQRIEDTKAQWLVAHRLEAFSRAERARARLQTLSIALADFDRIVNP